MFLTTTELYSNKPKEVIDLVSEEDTDIVETIVNEQIEVMRSYLSAYDHEAIFTATGSDRSVIIMKYLKDLVIYELYNRRSHELNPIAEKGFNEAMNWLDKVSTGKLIPNLPRRQVDTDGDGQPDSDAKLYIFGSKKNYHNQI